jgi:preprotein translocase subunit SecB
MPVIIHAQYVKDISFENPNAPETLRPGQGGPEMDVNINMDAKKMESAETENLYEVVLSLAASAKRADKAVFLADIQYGAVVSLPGVDTEHHHPLLLVEVPKTLFPFARQLLAELTQSGGYPPLLLNPVDFRALYIERFVTPQSEQTQAQSMQ